MDRKAVKGEAEENRVAKQVESVESEENKAPNVADKREEEGPDAGSAAEQNGAQEEEKVAGTTRQPFTSLSQVDQDMALARALQEQERAYLLIRMGGEDSSGLDSSGSGTYDYDDYYEHDEDDGDEGSEGEEYDDDEGDEDEEVVEGEAQGEGDGEGDNSVQGVRRRPVLDGSQFADDEAYARALQDQEDRETTAMMAMAGIHDVDEYDSESDGSQEDAWEEVDPDNMSYEELVALGEAVGVQNRGLASDVIASLPSSSYVASEDATSSSDEQCVICRLEYEAGDIMLELPCKHRYHSECIQQWLRINKVCPICSAEVSTSGDSSTDGPPASGSGGTQ